MTQAEVQRKFAHVGAQIRLGELRQEQEAILKAFPGLGARASARTTPTPRRRPYVMSPAKRAAVSKRMKAYWEERRRQRNGG